MLTQEAIEQIRERGFEISEDWLRNSIRRGKLKKPRIDASLRFDWTEADIKHVCEVLEERRATSCR